MIVLHLPERSQVLDRRADHAGHACDGLEHHGAVAIALGEEGIGAEAQQLGEAERDAVGSVRGQMVNRRLRVALAL